MGTFTIHNLTTDDKITFMAEVSKEHSLLMSYASDNGKLSQYFDLAHSGVSVEHIAKMLNVEIIYGSISIAVGDWVVSK